MAVKIPIVTVFDSKGLRQAQFQLNKVSGNISNLSRNFAIAGAAFGGIAIGLGKSVKVASDLGESVNALNVAFGRSAAGILEFGKTASTTLGVSSVDFNNAAVRFSAFAERIVGSGNDASQFIADISTRASDFASVFNIDVAEALGVFQSGLAGEAEPLKRFGINLLDSEVKAFAMANGIGEVGRQLTETEKVQARYGLLMEATAKTQGDFANTSGGLANGLRILSAQITDTQAEIGMALLPVLEEMLPVVRSLVSEFADKLKVAIANVDFESFITSIMNTVVFLVENIETITKVVTALFLLNTAYNVAKIGAGLFNVASVILGKTFVVTAGQIGLATGAVKLFRTALITTGIGALVVGLGFIIEAIITTNEAARNGTQDIDGYGEAVRRSGTKTTNAAVEMDKARGSINAIERAFDNARAAAAAYAGTAAGQGIDTSSLAGVTRASGPMPTVTDTNRSVVVGGAGSSSSSQGRVTFAAQIRQGVVAQNRLTKLTATGLSAGAAALALSTVENKKQFQRLQTNLAKAGVVEKRQTRFNRTAEGMAEVASVNAQNESDAREAESQRQAIIAAEKAAADERERIYQSFADSVTGIFGRIKDAIVGAFSLPELGGSTDSIIRNMDKLLSRVKSFSQNITKLSSMGLNPTLLAQVIQAGPVAGARLAASLVAGGADALTRINTGFGEIQSLGSEIGLTGTQSRFGTTQQQQIYNVTINGGLDSGPSIGKAVVDAIKAYERTSGVVFQGA